MGPIYKLFGPSQYWETILLMLAAAISVALVYELGRLLSGRRSVGLVAALLLTALPAFQYFSRTHLGYPMPFLLLGWLAAYHKRWNWVGLSFGLAITAHYNSWVPAGLSLAALAVFELRPATWKRWVGLGLCFAAPLLAMDGFYFLYTGIPFQWDREVFKEVLRLSAIGAAAPHPNWLWVWQTIVASNGLPLALILLLGVAAVFVTWPNKVGVALAGTFTGLAALYTLQGGFGRALLVSRILATSYAFWSLGAALVIGFLITRIPTGRVQQAAVAGVCLALFGLAANTLLFIRAFTQTAYPSVEGAVVRAAAEQRPVRYVGNFWIPSYFGQRNGVEALGGDYRWLDANAPGQAVLIFEGQTLTGLSQDHYQIETYSVDSQPDLIYPGLTEEAGILRRVEVWWPTEASQPIGRPADMPINSVYYAGSGCVTPPAYANGQLHFYQLVWRNLLKKMGLGL